MRILVTGGAGYIGSHTVRQLIKNGFETAVLDNLLKGHRESIAGVPFIQADLRDEDGLRKVFSEGAFDAVVHFAALSLVGESMKDPAAYYENNVCGTLNLLNALRESGVNKIVFSSTAAVYGEPESVPITEDIHKEPVNVYGRTKLAIERILQDFFAAYGLRYVALRYFNAAGADEKGDIGEDHAPETHLIPIIFEAINGRREAVTVFGNDYDTKDGTCIRDYIHVNDLASAHVLALKHLLDGGGPETFNLGNGKGYSVLEVINAVEKTTGFKVPCNIGARRAGDPAVLIASYEKIKGRLGWEPKIGLDEIVSSAWAFHKTHPNGY